MIFLKTINILLVLFFIYTVIYLCQIGIGVCISIYTLEEHKRNMKINKRIISEKMTKKIPVSVIIPSYNESDCIIDTIEALIEDDYPDLEIIVVDDGSTDNTKEIILGEYSLDRAEVKGGFYLETKQVLECYEKVYREKKIVYVCKENGGKADALNCGVNMANSPLCVMLDADTKVRKGAIKTLASSFLINKKTIVCAGVVGSEKLANYPELTFWRKALVIFQNLEYYRTFFMQRIMFDKMNANIIVSGAFAMFNTQMVKKAGGYHVGTVGEDMELTMRLHALCSSQNKEYNIAYAPEAMCVTQLPFTYRDYWNQRRRWHIGMLQSMKCHKYMIGNHNYGFAGALSGIFFILYELIAPFLELLGIFLLILANYVGLLNVKFTIFAVIIYAVIVIALQMLLIMAINQYEIEHISKKQRWSLAFAALAEIVIFHPLNMVIKLEAIFANKKYSNTWKHILRIKTE